MHKKVLLALFIVTMVFSAAAAGSSEPQTLNVLYTADTVMDGVSHFDMTTKAFNKLYPDVKVVLSKVDLSDGSTLTLDAMIAAGTPPNVYTDSMVRIAKYLVPSFVVDLKDKVDTTPYIDLSQYYKEGILTALPMTGEGQGMALNVTAMKALGIPIPKPDWTIDEFLKLCEKAKAGGYYGTGMFAANQSGDYLMNGWYASFGIPWYKDSSYNEAIVDATPVYRFYKDLLAKGYIPPNSAALTDDDYALDWSLGKYVATAFFPSWVNTYFDSAIKQGLIKTPHEVMFVPFPRAPGVSKVPTYFANAAVIAIKSGNEELDKMAAKFAELLNGKEAQELITAFNRTLSTRKDVAGSTSEWAKQVAAIIAANGLQDVGISDSRFTERRAQQFPIIQKVLQGKMTPEEGAVAFRNALNGVTK